MAYLHPRFSLPTEFDLPDSDGQPVDNELQILLPVLLRAVLGLLWGERTDWFFGINLGLYYDPNLPAVGPDAFLSLGVPRYRVEQGLRLSYLLWQEGVVPQWVLEIVSKQPGGEYGEKLEKYAAMGVLYYAIYNPEYWKRDRHEPFELYRLEKGRYVRQVREPVWMPEIGLGIGRGVGLHEGVEREWLYWYDEQGNRYPAPPDVIAQERVLRLEEQRARFEAEQLAAQEQQARLEAERAKFEAEQLAAQEQQARLEAERFAMQEQQARLEAEQLAMQEQQARLEAERLAMQEQQARVEAEQQIQQLLEELRRRGIDPDSP